jgi:hypothetical protein
VSSRKDRFEAGFFIIQWLLTLFMLIAICVVLYLRAEDEEGGIGQVCIPLDIPFPSRS